MSFVSGFEGYICKYLVTENREQNRRLTITMVFQVSELLGNLPSDIYSLVGSAAAIIVISRLLRGPNVSEIRVTHFDRLVLVRSVSSMKPPRLDPATCLILGRRV